MTPSEFAENLADARICNHLKLLISDYAKYVFRARVKEGITNITMY